MKTNLLLAACFMFAAFTASAQTTTKVKLTGVHSVPLVETKDSASAYVVATAIIDTRSAGHTAYRWYKVSGPACRILTPTQLGTRIFGMKPGAYRFGFIITDVRHNLKDTAYTTVTVSL